ncbi:transposase [Photobacterium sp. MCCC 1A19761]
MANKYEIDIQAFAKALQSGQNLNGKDGLLSPLIKLITEAALGAEVNEHLSKEILTNSRNGSSKKTVKTSSGEFELETPRDRNGSFEPQTVKKYQTRLTDEMEGKILSLFALDNSYQNIREHPLDLGNPPEK